MESYTLGQPVPLTFLTEDTNGDPADATTVTLTVTLPDGTTATPTVSHDATGIYTCDYTSPQSGRHTARFVATGANSGAADDVFDVTATDLAHVTVADLRAYLGDTSFNDVEVASALRAEQAAQAARCRIDPYTADLREALMRRVARNLAARAVPVATFTSFEGGGTSSRVPMVDAEIARLEGPRRRLVVG